MAGKASVTFQLDTTELRAQLEQRALIGLQRTAEFALGRAKHHAPVRAIFKRDRRGKAFTGRSIRSKSSYQGFLRSKTSRGRRAPFRGIASIENVAALRRVGAMGMVQSGGAITGTSNRPRANIGGRWGSIQSKNYGSRFTGHANSLFPVFRTQNNQRIAGDFRKVKQRGGTFNAVVQRGQGQPTVQTRTARWRDNQLSSRGRYEFKTKRGLHKGRIGGRLRDEIRITGPMKRGGTTWMYVESPTPYAIHQEYGTKRHRAQPFLRPALYESRNVLRIEMRKALTGHQQSVAGPRSDLRPHASKRATAS